MLDVLMTNTGAIAEALERFRERLDQMDHLLRSGDEAALQRIIEAAAIRRNAAFRGEPKPSS